MTQLQLYKYVNILLLLKYRTQYTVQYDVFPGVLI